MNLKDKKSVFDAVNKAYLDFGYNNQWSLCYGTFDTFTKPKYPVAFFGLNPGGKDGLEYEPGVSSENGNAYLVGEWDNAEKGRHRLQIQIQSLYELLAENSSFNVSHEQLMNSSLMANYVPFRSASWDRLDSKRKALDFSYDFWSEYFKQVKFNFIVTLGQITFNEILKIFDGLDYIRIHNKNNLESQLVGWGKITFDIVELCSPDQQSRMAIIRLPHLSRYSIFGRKESLEAIRKIAKISSKYLN